LKKRKKNADVMSNSVAYIEPSNNVLFFKEAPTSSST